jgi:hypothetical protein
MAPPSSQDERLRTFQLIGAWAAIITVIGIAVLGFWFIFRFPRF